MNIFGIGLPEMGLIMIVALLVFGPKKLPEIGRSMGKALKGFQDASKEFETEFKKEADRLEKSVGEPMKATLEKPRALAADTDKKSDVAEAEIAETVETVVSKAGSGEVSEEASEDNKDQAASSAEAA